MYVAAWGQGEMVRLERFELPTLGSVDCSGSFVRVSQCPIWLFANGMLSVRVLRSVLAFESFIPISFPKRAVR